MENTTVIIPVYKDWNTLERCLKSLKKYLPKQDKVIIVNDKGPNWEELKVSICNCISDDKRFEYFDNPSNMGFVKSCNRAVLELDNTDNDILLLNSDTEVTAGFIEEMRNVLYLQEKHGVVCPRSNNATLLTIPVRNNTGELLSEAVSYSVYEQMKNYLPRYSVIPTGVGFAFLIRRKLISAFGLFDETYGKGYNEENDFCMRINQYGFNVVMANYAYIYHFEGKSFGSQKNELEIMNRQTLISRYPCYQSAVDLYLNHIINPMEYFADLIADGIYPRKRILFSLYEIPSSYNGTAQYGITAFKTFHKMFSEKYDIHVLINAHADEFFKLSANYDNVWHPDNIQGTFHIAFSPSQIFNIEHLIILNRVALKYVFCMQDIISIRSNYLLVNDSERFDVFRKSIEYCAGMTSISKFSLKDTLGYYAHEKDSREIPTKVVYHCSYNNGQVGEERLPFDKYIIVFGNFYKHKRLKETIDIIKGIDANFIVIGASDIGKITDNIYGYKSGGLADSFVNELIAKSTAILFPSLYEGFGLPILDGIHYCKDVIVADTELNHELKDYFSDFSNHIRIFRNSCELINIIQEVYQEENSFSLSPERSSEMVATEIENFMEEVLNDRLDVELLIRRWNDMKYIENVHRMYVSYADNSDNSFYKKVIRKLEHKNPKIYLFLRRVKRKLLPSR